MPRKWRLRIKDILESIENIEDFTSGIDAAEFEQNKLVRIATERCLEIIGEAASHVPEEITARYPQIPWSQMRGLRNLIAHEYFGIKINVIWDTAVNNLPPLKPALRKILASEPDG